VTDELPVLVKAFDLANEMTERTRKFPRDLRFVLGDRILATTYDVFDALLEAKYSSTKRPMLNRANLLLEHLRFQVRLCRKSGVRRQKSGDRRRKLGSARAGGGRDPRAPGRQVRALLSRRDSDSCLLTTDSCLPTGAAEGDNLNSTLHAGACQRESRRLPGCPETDGRIHKRDRGAGSRTANATRFWKESEVRS
jgi:hypothetical protein